MKDKVKERMVDFSLSGPGRGTARFLFPEDFRGFAGHFPQEPILPGVCLLECVLATGEALAGRPLRLVGVRNAKFLDPARPGDPLRVECETGEDNALSATIFSGERRIAKLGMDVEHA